MCVCVCLYIYIYKWMETNRKTGREIEKQRR